MRQHHRGQPRSQAEADLDLHSPKVQLTVGEDESVEYLATYSEKSVPVLDATLAFKSSGVHWGYGTSNTFLGIKRS